MARTITLRYDATCRDCGADLPAGTKAKYYKRGFIYGLTCHARPQKVRRNWRRDGLNPPNAPIEQDGAVWSTDENGNVITPYE